MNTGLPRQVKVIDWPSWSGDRSNSIDARDRVSAAGFRLSMKGQANEAAPTAATATVARYRKSRWVSPSPSSFSGRVVSARPAERRVGKEGGSTCRLWRTRYNSNKKIIIYELHETKAMNLSKSTIYTTAK